MYHITKHTSETGKKLLHLRDRVREVRRIEQELADKYGIQKWRASGNPLIAIGGMVSLIFKEGVIPDPKLFRKSSKYKGDYVINLKSKEGKKIQREDFDTLPYISCRDVNACVRWKENMGSIGWNFSNEEYIAIISSEENNIIYPEDCEEITTTKYKELFS